MNLFLLVLAIAWVGYLAMWWRDARAGSGARRRREPSLGSGLATLAASAGRAPATGLAELRLSGELTRPPRSASAAARRRRQVLAVLAGLALVTGLAALVLGPAALVLHLAVDVALAGYVYLVVQRRAAAERDAKVAPLRPAPPVVAEHRPLRQTVNG